MGPSSTSPERLNAYAVCGRHLRALGHPVVAWDIGITDPERERAFHAAYLSLSVHGPACLPKPWGRAASGALSSTQIQRWLETAQQAHAGGETSTPEAMALADAMQRFGLPIEPWQQMEEGLTAIAADFPVEDLSDLVLRARGLGAAPTAVYFRLLAARPGARRYCLAPGLNAETLALDLGVFVYLVSVLRDVLVLDASGLACAMMPQELLDRHDLDREQVTAMRNLSEAPREFFEMMNDLASLAKRFYQSGLTHLAQNASKLPPESVAAFDRFLARPQEVLRAMQNERYAPVFLSGGRGLPPLAPSGPDTPAPGGPFASGRA